VIFRKIKSFRCGDGHYTVAVGNQVTKGLVGPIVATRIFTSFRLMCNKDCESAMCTSEVNARLIRAL
jgi:hypothetical protein